MMCPANAPCWLRSTRRSEPRRRSRRKSSRACWLDNDLSLPRLSRCRPSCCWLSLQKRLRHRPGSEHAKLPVERYRWRRRIDRLSQVRSGRVVEDEAADPNRATQGGGLVDDDAEEAIVLLQLGANQRQM